MSTQKNDNFEKLKIANGFVGISLSNSKDTVIKARIYGVQAVMPSRHLISYELGKGVRIIRVKQTGTLALEVVWTMAKDRIDASFDLFWQRALKTKEELNIEDLRWTRKSKLLAKLEEGKVESYCKSSKPRYERYTNEQHQKMVCSA